MSDAENWRRIPAEIFSQGRLDLIDEIFAPDYVEHVPLPPGLPDGREGVKAFIGAMRQAFPDLRFEIVHQLQQGDVHVGHIQGSGTMHGEFVGMPATGKAATWTEMHIGRFVNGQLVEHWGVVDQLSMLQQLGLAPEPGA